MTSTNGGQSGAETGAQPQTPPQLNVMGQYIKDFSFENPNAPRSLAPNQTQPAINIQINVGVGQSAPPTTKSLSSSKARPSRPA